MKHHRSWVHTFLTLVILFSSLAFSLASVQPVSAQSGTWYVSTLGSDENTCNAPESPCLTINGAIVKAADGDTIKVAVGTYTAVSGNEVVLIDKSITLSGGWDETFTTQYGTSTIDGGGARTAIRVRSYGKTVTTTVEFFTIQHGLDGINNTGILTINNSSINMSGTGITTIKSLALNNSTVSGNRIGIENLGTATIISSTISDLYIHGGRTILQSTILNNSCLRRSGSAISQGYNLIMDNTNCAFEPGTGDKFNIDPQLGPLVLQTGTHPLAPTSPAIDAGNNATCFGTSDQRGQPRADGPDADSEITCDIGAYEYVPPGAPASIQPVSGGNQQAIPFMTFIQPLKAIVLDERGTPLEAGMELVFSAPTVGPSGAFAGGGNSISVLTDIFGTATAPAFTANDQYGEYVVDVVTGFVADAAEFRLENGGWFVSPGGLDSNDCQFSSTPCLTISAALAKAAEGDTIGVAVGTYTGSGTEVVLIDKSITLSGGWDETFTAQSGLSTIDGSGARRGVTINSRIVVVLDHLNVQNGKDEEAGGIYNRGNLTINNSKIVNNESFSAGGGIYNAWDYNHPEIKTTLTINNTTISKNRNIGSITSGDAGGIFSNGSVILNDSTVSNNKVLKTDEHDASGIITYSTLLINNSTISGNTGGYQGGIYIESGTVKINNSTITMNKVRGISIRYNNSANLILKNTILAGNGTGGDCSSEYNKGIITSQGHNLIGNNTYCKFTPTTGDLVGTSSKPIDAKLGPLQDNGGSTFTHALYWNSPALNVGNPAEPGSGGNACLPTDQRGVARPEGSTCDIGAFEGFATTVKSINRLGPKFSAAPSVTFRVVFSKPVTGVDLAEPFNDFSLATFGLTGERITAVNGSEDAYIVTVNTGTWNENAIIGLDIIDDDSILDSSNTPLGGPGTGNGNFSSGQLYILTKFPSLTSPKNVIMDRTPTFNWTRIGGATKYQLTLLKGTKVVYNLTIPDSSCGTNECNHTPKTILDNPGTYTWKVRAMTGNVWQGYSPVKKFTVFLPRRGFWQGPGVEFYVTPPAPNVDNFAVFVYIRGCGPYKITYRPLVPIKNKEFYLLLDESYEFRGFFKNPTEASGWIYFDQYYFPRCGYISGGFNWTATWKNGRQPTAAIEAEDGLSITLIPELGLTPELQLPFDAFTVEPVE